MSEKKKNTYDFSKLDKKERMKKLEMLKELHDEYKNFIGMTDEVLLTIVTDIKQDKQYDEKDRYEIHKDNLYLNIIDIIEG